MKQWEYYRVDCATQSDLDFLGEMGWELVTIYGSPSLYVFKREKVQHFNPNVEFGEPPTISEGQCGT